MNWNLFVTELVAGITHGSLYALIALGYSMVYGILKLLNFAHGDIFMVGAFIGYGLMTVFGTPETLTVNLAFLIALMLVCAMIGGGLLGVMVERFAYRRLRKAPRIAPLITALGVSFFLENAAQLVLGAQPVSYNTYAWKNSVLWTKGFTLPGNVHVGLPQVIVVVGSDRPCGAAHRVRAAHADRQGDARHVLRPGSRGDDGDRRRPRHRRDVLHSAPRWQEPQASSHGLVYQQAFPYMGFQAGLFAFTAAVVGGIGSIPGAMLGGLIVGCVEQWAQGYLNGNWSDLFVFAILIVFMLVRPTGLLGTRAINKV